MSGTFDVFNLFLACWPFSQEVRDFHWNLRVRHHFITTHPNVKYSYSLSVQTSTMSPRMCAFWEITLDHGLSMCLCICNAVEFQGLSSQLPLHWLCGKFNEQVNALSLNLQTLFILFLIHIFTSCCLLFCFVFSKHSNNI